MYTTPDCIARVLTQDGQSQGERRDEKDQERQQFPPVKVVGTGEGATAHAGRGQMIYINVDHLYKWTLNVTSV